MQYLVDSFGSQRGLQHTLFVVKLILQADQN